MIAPEPVFEPRGTPISVRQRLVGLSKLGHQVDLATYHLGEDLEIAGVNFVRIPRLSFIKSIKVGPSWNKIPLDILLFLKSASLLASNEYDVIHTHEEAGFFSILLAKIFRKYHLYDMHSSLPKQLVNYEFGDNRILIAIFEYIEKLLINTCDAVIAIGPDLEQHVQKINPNVPLEMIENLPFSDEENGEDTYLHLKNELGLDDKKVIVYTGSFEKYQGLDMLIESAEIVCQKFPESKFILVGGKPDQVDEKKAVAVKQHVNQAMIFPGVVLSHEANWYLDMADILVSPRISGTSIPLKIYTYLQAGKPILATDIAAHRHVLDRGTAELVEPTKEGLAQGLMNLLGDEELRCSLGEQSSELVKERYSEANYLAKLEKIYGVFHTQGRTNHQRAGVTKH
jgi:glycosyltransferase involved in cell wall biosynthesis